VSRVALMILNPLLWYMCRVAVMSIPYTISAVISPFLGLVVDLCGKRAIVVLAAPLILIAVHAMMAYGTTISPIVPLLGQGLAYR
jgi:hypothetical protein